jgi:hypothetical protein
MIETVRWMPPPRQVAPGWVVSMGRLNRYIMTDSGGGQRWLKIAWIINFQKLTTIPMLLLLMKHYGNESVAAWVYLALQGSYALVWLVKDLAFPDAKFHQPATIGAGIASLVTVLGGRTGYPFADDAWFSLCISLSIVGSTIMIAADAQKYFTLRVRSGLIIDGMYRFVRHPNYLIWNDPWSSPRSSIVAWQLPSKRELAHVSASDPVVGAVSRGAEGAARRARSPG